jgi:hypothetical protein
MLEFYFQVLDEDVDVVNTNGNISPVKTPNSSTGKDLTKRTSDPQPVPSQGHYGFHSFPVVD